MQKLQADFAKICEDPTDGLSVHLIDNDFYHWGGILIGPPETPFEGGRFQFEILFPRDFPQSPPEFYFKTIIFHPNVDSNGKACTMLLNYKWQSATTVESIIDSICVLMSEPSTEDGYLNDATTIRNADKEAYENVARMWTQTYAV
ncbi:unnamed protein product [Blepharisma stoltei]|uniref:UBC core domain-containing protein n=1 Tax=Blepharisma stoltei TaxID=1481888 RepID=A0AAU9IJN9_9CILI|nr:unnamed protein product [Blepharisma stoltei]